MKVILPPIIAGTLTSVSSFMILLPGGLISAGLLSAILGASTMLAVALLGMVIRGWSSGRVHSSFGDRLGSKAGERR
jgi:hypothetical protein